MCIKYSPMNYYLWKQLTKAIRVFKYILLGQTALTKTTRLLKRADC